MENPRRPRDRGVHTAVVLPPDMLEKFRNSGRGVSEEIRRRLNLTIEADAHDTETRSLASAATWLADDVTRQSGVAWHSTRKGREALAVALQTWLEITARQESPAVEDLFGPDDPPTLGRSVARHYQRHIVDEDKKYTDALRLLRGEKP